MNRKGFSGLEIFALVVIGSWCLGIMGKAVKTVLPEDEKVECRKASERLRECGRD